MQINFDTNAMAKEEAAALVALLTTLYPDLADAFGPGPAAYRPNAPLPDGVRLAPGSYPLTVGGGASAMPDTDDDAPPAADAPTHDIDGLPWDERIHSANRALNAADGKWRKRRGVPDDTVAFVTAELRGTAPPPPPPAPQASAPPVPAPLPVSAPTPVAAPAAPAPSPQPAPPPSAGEAADMAAFSALMLKVTGAQTAGTLTPEQIGGLLAQIGVANLGGLLTSSAGREAFGALLDAHLATAG